MFSITVCFSVVVCFQYTLQLQELYVSMSVLSDLERCQSLCALSVIVCSLVLAVLMFFSTCVFSVILCFSGDVFSVMEYHQCFLVSVCFQQLYFQICFSLFSVICDVSFQPVFFSVRGCVSICVLVNSQSMRSIFSKCIFISCGVFFCKCVQLPSFSGVTYFSIPVCCQLCIVITFCAQLCMFFSIDTYTPS